MSILSDSLLEKDIHLCLKSSGHRDAVEELLTPLRRDKRVRDWESLRSSLASTLPEGVILGYSFPVFLHHGRGDSVSDLVIAAGRSKEGISLSGQHEKASFVFVAAIPEALNNEYLRILGAISRICSKDAEMAGLMEAADSAAFLKILEKGCLQ